MSVTKASHKFITMKLQLPGESAGVELPSVTSITPKIDYNKVDWQEFANNGWGSTKITGKTMSIAVEGKAPLDDPLYQKLMQMALGGGSADHNNIGVTIEFALVDSSNSTPGALSFNGSIEITDLISGASEDVVPFNFTITVDGEPTYVPEAL